LIKSRIFISCGQRGSQIDPNSEISIITSLKNLLEGLDFEVYVGVEQHSLQGFTENILSALEKCEYYLFIDFTRNQIINENEEYDKIDQKYRGSLFSHQELGIAVYLKKEHTLIFQEKEVLERDGIKGFIQANPITFDERKDLPTRVIEAIKKEGWHTGWRNELQMERRNEEYVDTFYLPTGSCVRFFHVLVKNNHNLKTAYECSVYLTSITDLTNGLVRRPPLVEFKWEPMKTKSVTILPKQTRAFDAFFVEKHLPNVIHLAINPFLVDFSGIYLPYIITGPGKYELEYTMVSPEFGSLLHRFYLHIGTNLDHLEFAVIE
jgi:hypothetical protein